LPGQHASGGVRVAGLDSLDGGKQECPLLEGKGVTLSKVFNVAAEIAEVEFCFDRFSPFDVGGARSRVAAEPVAHILDDRLRPCVLGNPILRCDRAGSMALGMF
jgi:hypothetical protein